MVKVCSVPTGVVLLIGEVLPTLGGRLMVQVPGVIELLALDWSTTEIINVYGAPDKGGCGVRLNPMVNVFAEPEAVLELQFKVKLPSESVAACPGLQFPPAPIRVNLFVDRL